MQTHAEPFRSLQSDSNNHPTASTTTSDWAIPTLQINDHSILASRASISSSQKWIEDLWSQRRYSEQTQQSANSIEQKRCTSETVSESESLNLLELLIDLNESPTNEKSLSPTSSSDNLDTESIKRITDQVELMEETNSINSIIDLASKEVLIASNVVEETKGKSIGKVIVEDSNLSNAQTVLNTLVKPSFKDEDFIIPTLPKGQHLRVRVISNWGDEKFVGLNGIEIFDANTMKLANIEKITCSKHGSECYVDRIIDGHYRTHDHEKIWQCELSSGNPDILFRFSNPIKIGLIRIWNHNKSRIYSYRGVRHTIIELDDHCIFDGEINRACGELHAKIENLGDTILFTVDEQLLNGIFKNDISFQFGPARPSTLL